MTVHPFQSSHDLGPTIERMINDGIAVDLVCTCSTLPGYHGEGYWRQESTDALHPRHFVVGVIATYSNGYCGLRLEPDPSQPFGGDFATIRFVAQMVIATDSDRLSTQPTSPQSRSG